MIFIFLLISCLFFISCEIFHCDNYKFLSKEKTITLSGYRACAYIKAEQFSNYFYFHIKAIIKNGYFNNKVMGFKGFDILPMNGTASYFINSKSPDEEENGKANGKIYDIQTLHFYIKNERIYPYFVFSQPSFEGDYIELQVDTYGISIAGLKFIILAGAVVVIFITFIIIHFYYKRKRNNILPPNQENLVINERPMEQEENPDDERISSIN